MKEINQVLTHGDYHLGNMIVNNHKIYIIDFDKSGPADPYDEFKPFIWNTKINMFFDSIKRINKIQDAELLLQGAYSGFASLKGVDKTRLDWAGEI